MLGDALFALKTATFLRGKFPLKSSSEDVDFFGKKVICQILKWMSYRLYSGNFSLF
jgi:hypothetical protein